MTREEAIEKLEAFVPFVVDDTDILAWMPLLKPYREDDEA